jgi:hypothetical protein
MSNSMDKKNIEVNNSISDLSFHWKSFFSDGSIIEQFENGIEHKFKEVLEKFNKLIRFSLVNKKYSQCFTVDLQNGFIIYNNYNIKYTEVEKKENIRLIFFRRHRVEIGTQDLKEKKHTIEYHLGYQWTSINNENRNIILEIDQNGDFIINGK